MTINIPYGTSALKISIPENRLLGILQNKIFPTKNIKKLLLKSLRLNDVPFSKKKVLIVVPDATRSGHLKEILPVLLKKISIPSRSIDIIIATGLHKRHTFDQLEKLLGQFILKHYRVLHHDPSVASVINFGKTKYDVPITLDRNLLNYDFIISIGVIEPHLYAGYSGGAKTVAIGLAGGETINATHTIKFLDHPSTTIGSLERNTFQETLWQIIDKIQPLFAINTVNNADGKALKIFTGAIVEVFEKGTDFAREVFEVGASARADIVICGIGYPKDINLYQASRAINYVLNVDRPVVKKGGVVIVVAELKDGIGESRPEKRFYEELKNMRSARSFVHHVKTKGCIAGEHRAYMVAKALVDYNVIFVTKGHEDFMNGLPFKYFGDLPEALESAEDIVGKNTKIYVIPRALATIAKCNFA